MPGSEEEFQKFISENRELIESLMALQKDGIVSVASAGRDAAHAVAGSIEHANDSAKAKGEEMFKATYSMFMDPEVQRHFMAMGMEFMMGLSAMMQRAPVPEFVRDAAESTEQTWKKSACSANDQCGAKKVQKVDISDAGKSEVSKVEISDGRE